MTEDAEELAFHMSLLKVQLQGLKNLSKGFTITMMLPLIAQVVGTSMSLTAKHPQLKPAAVAFGLSVGKLAAKGEDEPDPWPEIEENYAKLLAAIETPLPGWVKIAKAT